MKHALSVMAISICVATWPVLVRAGENRTNDAPTITRAVIVYTNAPIVRTGRENFSDLVENEFSKKSHDSFGDKFWSLSARLNNVSLEDRDGYGYFEDINSMGKNAAVRSVRDTARGILISSPVKNWVEGINPGKDGSFKRFVWQLFAGSVDSTPQRINPTDPLPSYSAETARTNTIAAGTNSAPLSYGNGIAQYGLPFWDGYGYVSLVFGHINHEPAIALFKVGVSTDISRIPENIRAPKIEGLISFVPFDQCHLFIGGAFYPVEQGSSKDDSRVSNLAISLQHSPKEGIGCEWFIGGNMDVNGHGALSAAFSTPLPEGHKWHRY